MSQPGRASARESRSIGPGRYCWVCGLVFLAGCQAPAGRVRATGAHFPILSRSVVFAEQLISDSAVKLACRPLETGQALGAASADWLWAAEEGVTGKRALLALYSNPAPLADDRPKLDPAALETELRELVGTELEPAKVEIYRDGQESLAALKQLIDQAQHKIDVVMFIWGNDRTGATVAKWLAAKAGPELRVRILVDGGGNLIFGVPEEGFKADVNRVVRELAEQPYVEVIRARHPFGQLDHRKLVIVDGQLAWTGGRNFYDVGFFGEHDLCVTLDGPLVGELEADFDAYWVEQGGRTGAEAPSGRARSAGKTAAANARARIVQTEPGSHKLAQAAYLAVDRARHHIYLENPYLFDSRMVCKLARARRRGVDVRVVLTLATNKAIVNRANRVTANRLLRAGVKVYLYPESMHGKAATVDGLWAYVGSANFDGYSLRWVRDLGLAIGAGAVIGELEETLFLPDFRDEWELKAPLVTTPGDYVCEALASLWM